MAVSRSKLNTCFSSQFLQKMNSGIVAVLLLSVPSLAQDCSYTDADGGAHDISKLTIDTYYSVDSENYNSFKFFFNFCGPITFDGGDVCPSGSTGCCEIQEVGIGKVDTPSEFYGHADQYSVQWQDGGNGQCPGPVVIITGDKCPRRKNRADDTFNATTRLYLKCNPDANIPVMKVLDDNYWECYVHISVETDVICAPSSPSITIPTYGLGLLIFFIFLVIIGSNFGTYKFVKKASAGGASNSAFMSINSNDDDDDDNDDDDERLVGVNDDNAA